MYDKEGFFKIKAPQHRTDPTDGCILESTHTIVALNIAPASFGHCIIFPKNQYANDLCSKSMDNSYILSSEEIADFVIVQNKVPAIIQSILNNNPSTISSVYKKRIENKDLMEKTKQQDRLQEMLDQYETFKSQGIIFSGKGIFFENRGAHSGRMISTYHTQFVPQLGTTQEIETYQAIAYLLHNHNQANKNLSYTTIINSHDFVINEDDHHKSVLESSPASFGHIAIIHKDPTRNIATANPIDIINFYEFICQTQNILSDIINHNSELLQDFYKSNIGPENTIISDYIASQRDKQGRIIQDDMTDKYFYHGGGSFSPLISDPRIYHFLPRYAFDREKQGTGTAFYKLLALKGN